MRPCCYSLYDQIRTADMPDPRLVHSTLSKDLCVVLETAPEKDRTRHYQTALDFAEDLRCVRKLQPIRARRASRWLRSKRWAQRNPLIAAFSSILVLLIAATLGFAFVGVQNVREANERNRLRNLAWMYIRESEAAREEDPGQSLVWAREAVKVLANHETWSQLHSVALESIDIARSDLDSPIFFSYFWKKEDRVLTLFMNRTAHVVVSSIVET